jgi:ribose transport system substrate-binding protein
MVGVASAEDGVVFSDAVTPAAGAVDVVIKPSEKDRFTIGFSNISVVNTWRVQMVEEAKYEASLHPEIAEFLVTDAGSSVNKQISDIEDLMARGIDALVVAPGSETALNPVLERVYDAGIPVVIFDADASPARYTSKIIADERYFGEVGAAFLVEAMGGKGDIIGMRGIAGHAADTDRWEAANDVFARYPDIKVVDSAFADWAYDKGKQVCETLIAAHPEVDGIWSSGGAMTQGCAEVLVESGLPLIPMSGEGNNGFLRAWKKLGFPSVAPISPTFMGAQGVVAALRALKGQPLKNGYTLKPTPITTAEIDNFIKPELGDSYWVGSTLPQNILEQIHGK